MDRLEDENYTAAVRAALAPHYEIEREIGHGAFATVFLASDRARQRDVAIKILKPEWGQAVARERFLREIRVTAQLKHPNILPLLDSGESGGFLYFVMPHVDGETLRQRLRRERQLGQDDAVRIAHEVAAGLSAAHARGVLHRDVKPENILLQGGHAIVADFGIAKAFTDAGVDTLTSTGLGIGTPGYMSPEQAAGEREMDQRSDVYSLACVLYEMLAGELPFTGPTAQVVVAKKLSLPVPSIRVVRETISPALDAVLQRGLAKVPADRYATADEFLAGIDSALEASDVAPPPDASSPLARAMRRRPVALVLAGVALVTVIAWGLRMIGRPAPDWVDGRPQSVVVIPFNTSTSTEQEKKLAGALAEAITRELNRWESIRAVPAVALAGPLFDLGLAGPTLSSVSDGVRVARQVSVQAMAAVVVRVRGDSAQAEVSLVDVGRGRTVDRPFESVASVGDVALLARPIISGILGLGGTNPDPVQLRRQSAFPDALLADRAGIEALDRGRLTEAEQSFRRAVEVDTTFALAKYHLAETLFWELRTDPGRLRTLAPLIAQLSTAAITQAHGLLRRDSLRIFAFYAFQSGDYEGARATYRELLAADPTDVHAMLLRGAVESLDPWLVAGSDGALRPRGNLNVAIRDVSEILRLEPTFDLGYANLKDIYSDVNEAAQHRACRSFEMPRQEVRLPWDYGPPEQQRPFCPIVQHDSIVWLSQPAFHGQDSSRVRMSASQFYEGYVALIRRWALYAAHEIRPRDEMISALLAQRRELGPAAPERLAAWADTALQYALGALILRSDTSPDDLVRIGGLYLGHGDVDSALAITDRALRTYPARGSAAVAPTSTLAANVYLTVGQPTRAMELASATRVQRFLRDSLTGGLISFGGAEPVIVRIQLLGATGIGGSPLLHELDELTRLWSDSRYSPRQRNALRSAVALSVAPALLLETTSLRSWGRDVSDSNPLWRALIESERDQALARRLLRLSIDSTVTGLGAGTQAFLQALIAERLGLHGVAVERFSRLDSLPLRLDGLDAVWGLQSLSRLRRAESYEALGDTANARRFYLQFRNLWARSDTLARSLVREATLGLERLAKRPLSTTQPQPGGLDHARRPRVHVLRRPERVSVRSGHDGDLRRHAPTGEVAEGRSDVYPVLRRQAPEERPVHRQVRGEADRGMSATDAQPEEEVDREAPQVVYGDGTRMPGTAAGINQYRRRLRPGGASAAFRYSRLPMAKLQQPGIRPDFNE